jgi:pimeloyl-ACP methyl ester carboxylesterase
MTDRRFEGLAEIARGLGVGVGDATPPADRFFDGADGCRLHALDWGAPQGHAPKVLLLHGGALTAQTWDFVCLGLRARFHCVALDLAGHGESGWRDDYSIEAHAADALAALDALGWARAHLAGMSLGGTVAAHAAAAAPERAQSLTLVDVGPGVDFAASATLRGFIADFAGAASIDAVVEAALKVARNRNRALVAYRMRALLRPDGDGRWRWKRDDRRPTDFPAILARVEQMGAVAPGLPCPALVVRGGESRILSDAAAARFAARFADGRWEVVPGAGHNVQEDNPAALAAVLEEFWRGR